MPSRRGQYSEWESNPQTLRFKRSRSAGWRSRAPQLGEKESNLHLLGQSQPASPLTDPRSHRQRSPPSGSRFYQGRSEP